jgi:predicted RNA-binding protein associated with RNAse of E/G family
VGGADPHPRTGIRAVSRLIELEYRRPGKPSTLYREWLVLDRPDAKVLLLDPYEGRPVEVSGTMIQDPGAPIVWFVFPGCWYDIGRFHRADGTFTGWYTNLCRPPDIAGDRWTGHDLFLDLWQPASDAPPSWLDEDELAAAVRERLIDAPTRKRILNERRLIEFQLREHAWPPPIARDIDLAQARSIQEASL